MVESLIDSIIKSAAGAWPTGDRTKKEEETYQFLNSLMKRSSLQDIGTNFRCLSL
jgi:hypothetical protein